MSKTKKIILITLPLVFLLAISLFVLGSVFFPRPYKIKGNAMAPAYKDEQYVMSVPIGKKEKIKRGDVVVAKVPNDKSTVHIIGRVIGLPGEKVMLRYGFVYINGQRLNEEAYLKQKAITDSHSSSVKAHQIPIIEGREVKIPSGQYFILGDNRLNSIDSRDYGFIPKENIIGKIQKFCFWHCNGHSPLPYHIAAPYSRCGGSQICSVKKEMKNRIIQDLGWSVFVKGDEKYQELLWWKTEDGLHILYHDPNRLSILSPAPGCIYGSLERGTLIVLKKVIQSLGREMNRVMTEQHFNKDLKNSSNNIETFVKEALERPLLSHYRWGYKKGNIKCVLEISSYCDNSTFVSTFGCTDQLDKYYTQQAEYLRDLKLKDSVIDVRKRIGNFAVLDTWGTMGGPGAYIIVEKQNGVWTELIGGQDYPGCSFFKKHNIPKGLLKCYEKF